MATPLELALSLAAASLLLCCSCFKCFFVLVYVIFVQYNNGKRYSKNIRDRSKNHDHANIIIIKKYIYYPYHRVGRIYKINRDERGFPFTQYITNWEISRARNTITHFKHHHRVPRLISNRMSV